MEFTEKTNFTMNVILFVVMLGFIITSVATAITWKNSIEYSINTIELEVEDIDDEVCRINEIQINVMEEQEAQNGLFIEIRTDLKWIRERLEND